MLRYCSICEYNDNCVYTSMPPVYKCTIDGEFHYDDICTINFKPEIVAHWIKDEFEWVCSNCKEAYSFYDEAALPWFKYCPMCGAKVVEEKAVDKNE